MCWSVWLLNYSLRPSQYGISRAHTLEAAAVEDGPAAQGEEQGGEDVREPILDPAADLRADVDLRELLRGAHDQASHDRPGNRGEAAEDQDRQRLQGRERQRELDAGPRAPEDPRDQGDEPRGGPDDDPDLLQRDPDRQRRLVVVRDRAERPSHPGLAEEDRKQSHE